MKGAPSDILYFMRMEELPDSDYRDYINLRANQYRNYEHEEIPWDEFGHGDDDSSDDGGSIVTHGW